MKAGKYGRLSKYALRQWPSLAVTAGLTVAGSAVAVLQPWPLKLLVDHALGSANPPLFLKSFLDAFPVENSTALLLAAGILSVGLFALSTALEIGLTYAWAYFGERVVYNLAADLFHRLQRVSLVLHNRRPVGDSLARLTGDTYCVYAVVQNLLSRVQSLLTLVTVGFVAWNLDPRLTAVSLLVAPVQAASSLVFGPWLKQRAKQTRALESSLLTFVHQTLTAIPLVQAFGTEERNGRQFQRLAADAVIVSQRTTLLANAYAVVPELAGVLCNALVLYVGAQRIVSGAVSVGSLLVFLVYMRSMQQALGGLLSTYGSLKPLEANMDRVFEILDSDPGVRDAAGARPLPPATAGVGGHVLLENVTFGYEDSRAVLKGITLEARPGEIVALVGQTGAGKSTLVSLIPRFFDPWQGRVMMNGVDVRDIQIDSLRQQVSLVLQEPFLLPFTIAENIAYGRPEATRDEIVAAAITANADEFIRRLPEGYHTVIGERGATLSGGEKQRIAIARALLKDAPILILDEATSALDANTEELLLKALERLVVGRTSLIIAHRLSTIRNADRIVVIENGQIVESGTHRELLARDGHYRRFHSLQFGACSLNEVAQ